MKTIESSGASRRESFAPARSRLPVKVLHDVDLLRSIVEYKRILPRHLHLRLTNHCNLRCESCISSNRDRNQELSFDHVLEVLRDAVELGCRAVTLSGGGEPTMHPDFEVIMKKCAEMRLSVGLTTNGTQLYRVQPNTVWCRVSLSSRRELAEIKMQLLQSIERCPDTVWSFNYILHECVEDLRRVVQFTSRYNFALVRVVPDILDLVTFEKHKAEARVLLEGIDNRVEYQSWSQFSGGAAKCWVGLLKPTFAADGRWLPCCAVEFPGRGERRELGWPVSEGLREVIEAQEYFDGSKCAICYYDNYNKLLQSLLDEVEHVEWS